MLSQYIAQQIASHVGFSPTPDQQQLVEQLADFLTDPQGGEAIFVLNGYAGTGKTTMVAALVKALREAAQPVVLLAPTGRAAKVMASYAGHAAYTIHKKIYRQANVSDGVGTFALGYNALTNALFVVDEASMIANSAEGQAVFGSGRLLDDLVKYVRSGKGCRLMLVGDSAQLPPVGLPLSPALNPDGLTRYGASRHVFLREVVRQAEASGILHNATRLRAHLEAEAPGLPQLQMGFPDVQRLSGEDILEALAAAYDRWGVENVAVITRSNRQANRYNAGIRASIFGREEELVAGERLMVVKNSYAWIAPGSALSQEVEFIANGDTVVLQRLRKHREMYGLRFADATVALPDYGHAELDCRLLLDTLTTESASLSAEAGKAFFAQVHLDYAHVTPPAKRYADIRADPYFSALQVKHAYAVTCHKAQGGQWKAVFVDHGYLPPDTANPDLLRWLYTAFTRATDQLFLVNFDKRFFG
ncbi:MAG: AAA family ATPase [Prevotellaceae bacterium]|jgi:exodeoxyribonuclease-5|nr:AAA family ATPase [Prevotellaceae bacterium]